jgi:hypothetical protein
MNELKKRMIERARREHRAIFPCATRSSLDDCFTVEENEVYFWYNTEDHSTHILIEKYA